MQPVGAHGLDVSRPLVDEHHIEPGICEVGRDATSVRASAKNCDFLFHRDSKARALRHSYRVLLFDQWAVDPDISDLADDRGDGASSSEGGLKQASRGAEQIGK